MPCRSGEGIVVRLLWEPHTNGVFVAVADECTNDRFEIRVPAADALEAFRHPYAYDQRHERTLSAPLPRLEQAG